MTRVISEWEPCEDDGCWDFAFVIEAHVHRSFGSILALARSVNTWVGENGALLAWSGRWDRAYMGTSPLTDERGPCTEDGESLTETDDEGNPVPGFTDIRPATWVTMNPDVHDPRSAGPLRMRVPS